MGRRKETVVVEETVDPTEWMLGNAVADFILMNTNEIRYMCMFGYAFFVATNVFNATKGKSFTFRFVQLICACTGGGIIVPILLNLIPVPIAQDAFPVAVLVNYFIHTYFPVIREVYALSTPLKTVVICLFEILRAMVVCKFTGVAGASIPASDFSFPVFGPIFCGTIGGCGGAFFPLNKGFDPIAKGVAPPMFSAFLGATFFHLFTQLPSLNQGMIDAPKKANVMVAIFFMAYSLFKTFSPTATPVKKEKKTV